MFYISAFPFLMTTDTPKKFDSTPGYADGWFNGNPKLMIEAGTYDTFRERMPGLKYSPDQIAVFDDLNEKAKDERAIAKKKRDIEIQKGKDVKAAKVAAATK